jgi:hypothetical protein
LEISSINYIVSGLERSGTSMMMQVLQAGGVPIVYDNMRQPDVNNPKGYYELEGGKVINRLIDGSFTFEKYKGKFIKITAYGLLQLPPGNYKIIYMERNIEEVLDSMEKMAKIIDENRQNTKESFMKLNDKVKNEIQQRPDIKVLVVDFNDMLMHPSKQVTRIHNFIDLFHIDKKKMVDAIDNSLYRQKRI